MPKGHGIQDPSSMQGQPGCESESGHTGSASCSLVRHSALGGLGSDFENLQMKGAPLREAEVKGM